METRITIILFWKNKCTEHGFYRINGEKVTNGANASYSMYTLRQMSCTCASILMSSVKWNPSFFINSRECYDIVSKRKRSSV